MFGKRKKLEETKEYKDQAEEYGKKSSDIERIEISPKSNKPVEPPREPTLKEQVIEMTDVEYRTAMAAMLSETLERIKAIEEKAYEE